MKRNCEHLGFDNKQDCKKEATYMCACCGAGVCDEHLEKLCPYGGEPFIEL
jgi:hypothetical protein